MSFRLRWPSKSGTFAVLMLLAAAACVLPASWTNWTRGVVQLIGLPQWVLSSSAREAGTRATGEASVTPEELRRLREDHAELRRLLANQEDRLQRLTQRYQVLTGIREELGEADVQILVAPVLGYDSSPRRETLLIGRGGAAGVRKDQWVAAGVPPGRRDPQETGRQLLMRQWLIGRVREVYARESRVQLVSDPKFEQRVCVARLLEDGRRQPTPANYVLTGLGRGRMRIAAADADYFKLGYEQVLPPPTACLPAMLSIGRIVGSAPLEESALHFLLDVQPWADARELRYVYVVLVGS